MGGYVMGISSIFPNLLPQLYMKIYKMCIRDRSCTVPVSF